MTNGKSLPRSCLFNSYVTATEINLERNIPSPKGAIIDNALARVASHLNTLVSLVLLMLATTQVAHAQSVVGSIYGQAEPGTAVIIKNQDTGLTRESPVDANGKFSFSSLPTGVYSVQLQKDGQQLATQTARVNPGVGTAVSFTDESEQLETVVVLGTAVSPIDTTTAQVSTTYSMNQLSDLPVAQSVLDVALLAPGVIRGTSGANEAASPLSESYSQSASFGGASVAENQYYIDGFNVTNLFRNLQYADLPYYAIDSEQIVTGGYGPEYGLSTGGVVSIQTRKGSNDWKFGGAATWEPNSLRAKEGPAAYTSDGQAYRDFSKNTHSSSKYDMWASGPVVPDRLFFFANVELTKQDGWSYPTSYATDRNVWDQNTKSPFGMVKLDWNINDSNVLEITGISNQSKYTTAEYSPATNDAGFVTAGNYAGTDVVKRGGWIGIGKYTSHITDELTVSALYGQLKSKREEYQYASNGAYISYNGTVGDYNQPGCPYVVYSSSYTGTETPSCYVSSTVGAANGEDTRKAGRADVEYKVPGELLGTHTVKGGYDIDKWNSYSGESYAGGTRYDYYQDTSLYSGSYVRVRHFQTGANAGVDSNAFYFKDDWHLTKDLLIQLGVRSDSFKNLNGAGQTYLKQDNIWQPRLGFAWDMKGDSSSKLYGSYGIYSLPVTAGVSIRGASASIYSYQYYRYSAIDPVTGAPTLTTPLSDVAYYNGENGQVPAAGTFASTTLDPTQQEEFIVGFQQNLGRGWMGGVRFTYRNLLKTIDDMCDSRPFDKWAARTGWTGGTSNVDDNVPCFVVNPGYGAHVNYDIDGNGTLDSVNLSASDIGLPKAIRKYVGVELTLEKAWSDNWYAQMSYTWAHNYGNAEGLADSDISQLDIGTTLAFDFPEIMEGSYGNLPNDHRHTFKALGAYKPFSEWTFSGSLSVQTGKPINCIGLDEANDVYSYGAYYHYCDGHIVPRGTSGTTDTITDIDVGIAYSPSYVPGLSLQASIFNLFNSHGITNVDEFYTDDQGSTQTSYKATYSYQTPRYVQLSVKYDFGSQHR